VTLLPRQYRQARAVAARALRGILQGEDALGWLAVLTVELRADGLAYRADRIVGAGCTARVRRDGCREEFAEWTT
jgi:hypothetical protein